MIYFSGFRWLYQYNATEIENRLQGYFKLMIIQNPFERLVNVYKYIFEGGPSSTKHFAEKFGTKVIQEITYNHNRTLSFPAFIQYLIKANNSRHKLLEQWTSFNELCHPAYIKWDYIAKTETLQKDYNYLKSVFNERGCPQVEDSLFKMASNATWRQYYSGIHSASIENLAQLYKNDLILYNYTFPCD